MPFQVAPALIEQSDFDGGYAPDIETTGTVPNILPDMLNLLPDPGGSSALVTRKGFKRLREELGASGHYVKHIFPYSFSGGSEQRLICVVSNDTAATNNVRLYEIDLSDNSVSRIDTAGVQWANPDRAHWGMEIDQVFYGGSPGNGVYSWDGTTWNDDAANNPNWDTLVDSISPGAGEVARDFAFKGTEKVIYGTGKVFTPVKGIRYPKWEDDENYSVGERVSRKTAIGGETYWRSYRCTAAHLSVTADNAPGTGTSWRDFWQKVRLPLPQNDDNETSPKWYRVLIPQGSSVAVWYADRLWIRADHAGGKDRLLYSAPVHPDKGEDIPDIEFSMYDWQPGNDIKGPGGGWIPFSDGKQTGIIEACWVYGQYLLVFKRQATWILSGASEDTFSVRRLSRNIGAVSTRAVCELDSLVYVLSDDGLYVTDGTAIQPVENNDHIAASLTARIDAMRAEGAAGNLREPELFAFQDMLWISLPCAGESEEELTWVYDPDRAAFYKLNLPVLAAQTHRYLGRQSLFFSAPESYNANADLVYVYDHDDAGDEDDTGAGTYAAQAIPWHVRTAWWVFGVAREQRRIRRTWAVVKGALTHTLKAYRDWDPDTAVATAATVVSGTDPTFIEGKWFADSHAVSFEVSGTEAPAALYGVAVDTQLRRRRYGVANP